ncbi:MAG: hypothetical protein AAF752_17050 [Bacteroidota bacterium]
MIHTRQTLQSLFLMGLLLVGYSVYYFVNLYADGSTVGRMLVVTQTILGAWLMFYAYRRYLNGEYEERE